MTFFLLIRRLFQRLMAYRYVCRNGVEGCGEPEPCDYCFEDYCREEQRHEDWLENR